MPVVGEFLRRLGPQEFADLLKECIRFVLLYALVAWSAPWDGAIEKIQQAQVRDRIVKNERMRAMMDCPSVAVTSERFEACLQLQLDIQLDRKKLERRTRIAPLAKATARVGS